jgi:glutaredoxin 3
MTLPMRYGSAAKFQVVPGNGPGKAECVTATVEVYTKWGCGFCQRAIALLNSKAIGFAEHDITMGGPKRAEMLARVPGAVTVPQIFIDGAAIGGCDDLFALEAAGRLDPLLEG